MLLHPLSLFFSLYSLLLLPSFFPHSLPPFFSLSLFSFFIPPSFLLPLLSSPLPFSCFHVFPFTVFTFFFAISSLSHRTHQIFTHHLYLMFSSFLFLLLCRHFFFFLIVFFFLFFDLLSSTQSIFLNNQLS